MSAATTTAPSPPSAVPPSSSAAASNNGTTTNTTTATTDHAPSPPAAEEGSSQASRRVTIGGSNHTNPSVNERGGDESGGDEGDEQRPSPPSSHKMEDEYQELQQQTQQQMRHPHPDASSGSAASNSQQQPPPHNQHPTVSSPGNSSAGTGGSSSHHQQRRLSQYGNNGGPPKGGGGQQPPPPPLGGGGGSVSYNHHQQQPPLHHPHHQPQYPLDMMRRGSLNSAAGFLDDSFFRRPSLQFSGAGDTSSDLFHRRDSMDSSTAALDAAILDLSRRRYSMATTNSSNEHPHEQAITARQQQLQQQQRELEQQQKELEIQRQELIASMQQRSYNHPTHPSSSASGSTNHRNSSLGGSLGLGSVHSQTSLPSLPPLLHRGSGVSSSGGGTNSSGGNWWICQVCNAKAFSSHEEAMQHESTCSGGGGSTASGGSGSLLQMHPSSSMHHPHPSSMDHLLSQHSSQRNNSNNPFDVTPSSNNTSSGYHPHHPHHHHHSHHPHHRGSMGLGGSPLDNSTRGVVSMGMDSSRGGSLGFDSSSRHGSLSGVMVGMDTSSGQPPSSYTERTTVSMGPFAMLQDPIPLSMPSDKDWLTPLHCFVRRHCVEVFTATENDVATPSKGKRKPIQVGQIGIRCPHCHVLDANGNNKARERGSVYYPTTIASIYNATMNLLQRHLHNCPAVPDEIMRRYETLKADDARSGTSKRYWIESALSLGLVDTPASGIRHSALRPPPLPSLTRQQESTHQTRRSSNEFFSSKSNADQDLNKAQQPSSSSVTTPEASSYHSGGGSAMADSQAPLVSPEDKPYATSFSHHLLRQMQPCVFTEADRLGKRKGLPPGFPGLACRHCFGGYGSGRFFPSSIKTLSDTSKTLNVLHNHMMRCRKCPGDVKETLEQLRGSHDEERAKMKFGSQKAFFARIWERLHGKDAPGSLKRGRAAASARSQPSPQSNNNNNMGYPGGMHQLQQHMPPPGMPGGYHHHASPHHQHPSHHRSPQQQQQHTSMGGGLSGLDALASVSSPSKRHQLDANV